MLTIYQPLIKSEVITLENGACSARVLTEISAINTILSHLFTAMKAGANFVFLFSQREPNFVTLMPSIWTYPPLGQDVISTAETVNASEYRSMVNFDWFTSSNLMKEENIG